MMNIDSAIDKLKKSKIMLVCLLSLIAFIIVIRLYYLNNIKYAELEKKLVQIHLKMRKDLSGDSLNRLDHLVTGMATRNKYNLWSEESELSIIFKENGVSHPDDMSGIIMETYLRSQQKIPFKLHRLIKLQSGFYLAKDKKKYLKKLTNEFYLYKRFNDDQRPYDQ